MATVSPVVRSGDARSGDGDDDIIGYEADDVVVGIGDIERMGIDVEDASRAVHLSQEWIAIGAAESLIAVASGGFYIEGFLSGGDAIQDSQTSEE